MKITSLEGAINLINFGHQSNLYSNVPWLEDKSIVFHIPEKIHYQINMMRVKYIARGGMCCCNIIRL